MREREREGREKERERERKREKERERELSHVRRLSFVGAIGWDAKARLEKRRGGNRRAGEQHLARVRERHAYGAPAPKAAQRPRQQRRRSGRGRVRRQGRERRDVRPVCTGGGGEAPPVELAEHCLAAHPARGAVGVHARQRWLRVARRFRHLTRAPLA